MIIFREELGIQPQISVYREECDQQELSQRRKISEFVNKLETLVSIWMRLYIGHFHFSISLSILGNRDSFWIGGKRGGGLYDFYWFGYDEKVKYTDFHQGDPNNWMGNENCLLLWSGDDLKWVDANCDEMHSFICEEDTEGTI